MSMVEIERKFLVNSTAYRDEAEDSREMEQAFLSTDPERTVRVRRSGDRGWLTIKGMTRDEGTTRWEWEYPIPEEEAAGLLGICLPGTIIKTRFTVRKGPYLFEVDEFHGRNEGLVLAEIELPSADAVFERPHWLGKEVTGDPAYYNSQLTLKPFTTWKKKSH